jgi:hypothetical protein
MIDDIVKGNPQWWMLEIFYGFNAHILSLAAMKERYKNKIMCLKEEGDSSHVNQAYGKCVAKADKAAQAESLGMQRRAYDVVRLVVTYGCHRAVAFSKWTNPTKISARSARAFSLLRLPG